MNFNLDRSCGLDPGDGAGLRSIAGQHLKVSHRKALPCKGKHDGKLADNKSLKATAQAVLRRTVISASETLPESGEIITY